MRVTPIKTPLVRKNDDLLAIFKKNIRLLPEKSVLVITSKIISFCQGRIVTKALSDKREKHQLVKKEADLYLDPHSSKYNMMLTIKDGTLAVNAGIDESNANGGFVLWPVNLQKTTNKIWRFLRHYYQVKQVGVIVSDSRTIPLRWGVIGTAICHCGFNALHDYRGQKDLFNRKIKMSQINIVEAVAVAAVLEMGEVAERTPLCLVEDIKKIEWQNRVPTKQERINLTIKLNDDVYGPLLNRAEWKTSV